MRLLPAVVALIAAVLCGSAALASEEGEARSSVAHRGEDPCASFGRCSACVYDSFPPQSLKPLNCVWCEDTATCSSNASATCSVVRRSSDPQPMCSDMRCSAARNTGNIYWCRGATVAAAIFSFVLLFITAVYWVWMRAIHQLPWKYPGIHQALDRYQASGERVELVSRVRAMKAACPVCHVAYGKTYAPGSVFFWCDVARFAFVPFVIGLGCSIVSIFSLFTLSLRPSFADWYYAVILAVPFVTYVAFGAWVGLTQRPVHGDEEQRPTAFVALALELRGRPLSAIFELRSGSELIGARRESSTALHISEHSADSPRDNNSMVSEQEAHADTMQSLELDTDIPGAFRQELRDTMRSDEFIAWTEHPSSSVILVDMRWLICSYGCGVVAGLFLLLLASIQPSTYPESLLAPAPMRVAGFVVLIFSAFMLAATVGSMHRQYVLTNRRLIVLSSGLFGNTHTISTELTDVKFASVHGYQELGYTVLTFSWGKATGAGRKMPVLNPIGFVGLTTVEELLERLTEHCHGLDSADQRASLNMRRSTWRVYITAMVFCAALAPVVLVSPRLLPDDLALFALLIWWFMCWTIGQRGWRVLSTTSAHLNLAKEWGRFNGGFSFSRLIPSAIGRRLPRRPTAVVPTVDRPMSPSLQKPSPKASPATEL